MEKPLNKPMSDDSEAALTKTSSKEKNAWAIPLGSAAYHASTDTSLFSSSLPVLPHPKLNFNESEHYGQSIDDSSAGLSKLQLEDKIKDPLEEVESSPVGFLLPGDEDELLAGLMDDFDLSGLPSQLEDLEDDFFGSGGLEMEPEDQNNLLNGFANLSMYDGIPGSNSGHFSVPNGAATVVGEHPYGEHPSRTLFVRNINSNVEDSELKSLFEQFGDIRTLYTACKHRGFVMISYYDIRAARTAMRALQNKPLRRRKLDIHFSIPKENPSEKDINQGTLVVFNLDPSVSNEDLRQIFGAYGEVKEIRETPHKRHHKFIEFYDVRAADAALKALNRSDIAGKRIKLEPSRPGGARRNLMQQLSQELEHDEIRSFRHSVGSPVASSPPGSWSNFGSPVEPNPLRGYSQSPGLRNLSPVNGNLMPGLASILPGHLSSPKIAPIGKDPARVGHLNQVTTSPKSVQGVGYQHSFSVPEQKPALSMGSTPFGNSKASGTGTLSGPQFLWGSPPIHSERTDSTIWPTSSMAHPFASNGQGQGYLHSRMQSSFLGSHHVGSAPSGNPLDRHFGFFPESPQTSYINPHAFGSGGSNHNSGSQVRNIGTLGAMNMGGALSGNFTESGSPSSRMMPLTRNGPIFFGNGSYGGGAGTVNGEGLIERGRSRKIESGGSQIDNKKQYQLDLEKIMNGGDTRTTLMIKNIPNKYTSKMLLAAIDETHKSTYDFLYLPIDFKVGGRFVTGMGVGSLSMIVPMYNAEIAPPEVRGALVGLQQLSITLGIMISFWIDYGTNFIGGTGRSQKEAAWLLPLALQLAPAVLLGAGMLFMPFSPRWLVHHNRETEAHKVLARLRNLPQDHELVELELAEIKAQSLFEKKSLAENFPHLQDMSVASTFKLQFVAIGSLFKSRGMFKRVVIATLTMFFQQWTGINAILYYAPTIFQGLGLSSNSVSLLATGVVGIAMFLATIPAVMYVDSWGRKPTLVVGALGMAASHFIIAAIVGSFSDDWPHHQGAGWAAVVMVWLFVIHFGYSWGPCAWIVVAEVWPLSNRPYGIALGASSNWMNNFIVGQVTPDMLTHMKYGTYIFFGALTTLGAAFIWFYFPETKGLSLEEMDILFGSVGTAEREKERWREVHAEVGLTELLNRAGVYHGTPERENSLEKPALEEAKHDEHKPVA